MKEKYEQSVNFVVADFETPLSHQDKEHYSTMNDNTDSVNSNGDMVGGSVVNTIGTSTLEQKEKHPKNVSSNLDDVTATTYNSTTDKTELIILETHRVNNNNDDSLNANIQCNSFIIEEECSIGFVFGQPDNLFAFPDGKDVLDNLLFYNNDNSIDNEVDVGNDGVPDDNDHYGVHSEFTNINPSMIPNNGERIRLLSSVSRGVILSSISRITKNNEGKNTKVKNKEVKNEEVKNVYHYSNNYAEVYVDITSATLKCLEWYVKKYQVDNDNIDDTELE